MNSYEIFENLFLTLLKKKVPYKIGKLRSLLKKKVPYKIEKLRSNKVTYTSRNQRKVLMKKSLMEKLYKNKNTRKYRHIRCKITFVVSWGRNKEKHMIRTES